jgi:hypothetical protein
LLFLQATTRRTQCLGSLSGSKIASSISDLMVLCNHISAPTLTTAQNYVVISKLYCLRTVFKYIEQPLQAQHCTHRHC